MKTYPILTIGGGVASGYLAEELVEQGLEPGQLGILSAETRLPYDRPPLSKGILQGTDNLDETLINSPDFYDDHGIDVLLGSRALEVDLERKIVDTPQENVPIRYERLVIATGSRLRTLTLPGTELGGIHYLRHDRDSSRIRRGAADAREIVVVGGSFIGTEVAASLARGSDARITLVHPGGHILEGRPLTPRMAAFFEGYFRERGIDIRSGERVTAFEGDDRVESVILESGTTLSADLVVAGVGVAPNTALFENSGLILDDGIRVDEHLRTDVDGVFAIGDVARYRDLLFDKHRRIEHWDNAFSQGRYLARRLAGTEDGPFRHLPYFFSDVFDLSWEYWGDQEGADDVVYRGDMEEGSFSAWWLRDGRVVAAFVMDRPDEEREAAQELIRSGEEIDPETLRTESSSLPTG
ncbi:MAG: FAD-dependent oxidoreductase [Thermoanaerobaculia bacterium]|nr:FAD-dependent oxidoreductase [Thermoanaerobaculia bacterium]